jgi:hypothetical protein
VDPINVPAELILDIALGLHPHDKIAQKHGITEHDLLKLHTQEWFNRQVNAQRESLEKAGFDFKAKVKLLAEDMVVDVYHAAKKSDAVTPKLDAAKMLTKLAGLEPNPALAAAQGAPSFSISISLPKSYIDALHDKPSVQEITLKHGALDHVEDAQLVSVDELQGESPAVVPAVLTNKDLA